MKCTPNAQYNVANPNSLSVKIACLQRRKMFNDFIDSCLRAASDTVLDVGVTSDQSYECSNYLISWLSSKERITAVGIDDASFLETIYHGVKFIRADGLDLPFKDQSFDVVHASAVIEHVGSFDRQVEFIRECARVSKRSFYITTPSRFYPIEFHTVLPLVHWLPKKWFRSLMRLTGRSFFSLEKNLNLMSHRDVAKAACLALRTNEFSFEVKTVKLFGWSSNLMLFGSRRCG